jgi:hypothetical protein
MAPPCYELEMCRHAFAHDFVGERIIPHKHASVSRAPAGKDFARLRIPDEADQRSGMMSITIPG